MSVLVRKQGLTCAKISFCVSNGRSLKASLPVGELFRVAMRLGHLLIWEILMTIYTAEITTCKLDVNYVGWMFALLGD